MNLDELRNEWDKDAPIDTNDLLVSAATVPNLHAKYLRELIEYRLKIVKLQNEINDLRTVKTKYFKGEMTKAELDANGWEQYQYRVLKGDIEALIEADKQYQTLMTREAYVKAVIYFLESVMSEIKARSFHVKNIIEWSRFKAGA